MSAYMNNNGERVVAELYQSSEHSYLIYLFHIATYRFSMQYVTGKSVLDFGCGTGYGTHLVASASLSVTGVDISTDAIMYATAHYPRPNITFQAVKKVESEQLPFSDNQFEVVLSFQVIEHVTDTRAYLDEVYRVLQPGGVFIIATPDRTSRLFPRQKPWNIFHVHEYDETHLRSLLESRFKDIESYTMSGKDQIICMELSRTKRLRWITLPFTFPGAPEWLRLRGLRLLRFLNNRRTKLTGNVREFEFDERHIYIGKDLAPSVNLIAVAKK
ncbi:MAG: class I SAM-dependent methyltransferase [Acidiferrobacterales bacterium]